MLNSGGNVYHVARRLFDYETDDEDFDLIARYANVHKCIMCDEWKEGGYMEDKEVCSECMGGD